MMVIVAAMSAFTWAANWSAMTIGILAGITLSVVWFSSYAFDWLAQLDDARRLATEEYLEDCTSLAKVPLPSVFEPPTKYLSIIIPAYNEENRLPNFLEETMSYVRKRAAVDPSFTYEIILVDDGSRDGTAAVGFAFVKKHSIDVFRVIRQRNRGKGAAVRKGMQCSRGQLLLMADADGATKLPDVEKLEREALELMSRAAFQRSMTTTTGSLRQDQVAGGGGGGESPSAMISAFPAAIFGSRAHLEKQAIAKRKWYRNFLMKGFHLCVLLAAGGGVRDTQCGFKLFTRAAARQLFVNQRLNRWCFDVEIVYLAKRLRIPVREVAVTWTEIPGSKIRLRSIIHMLLELILLRLAYGFRLWKIYN